MQMVWAKESDNMDTEIQTQQVEEEKTISFDEMLQNPMYQKEFDKRISKALDTAKIKWDKEAETRRVEADKLARMDEEQKKDYEIQQITERALSAESELNAYKLKDEATRQASEKGVDLDLMQTLDYTKESAESIKSKIDIFASASKKIHERAISEYSKEVTPQSGETINRNMSLGECKTYEDFVKYYEEHPDA